MNTLQTLTEQIREFGTFLLESPIPRKSYIGEFYRMDDETLALIIKTKTGDIETVEFRKTQDVL